MGYFEGYIATIFKYLCDQIVVRFAISLAIEFPLDFYAKWFISLQTLHSMCRIQKVIGAAERKRSGLQVYFSLVSCPPRARLLAVNEVEFLVLIPQNGGRPIRLRDR